jgi:hypothetical protein
MGAAGVEFEGQTPTGTIPLCSPCDPEMMRLILIEMCLEANVQLLFETQVTAPILEGSVVTGIITESKQGRQAIRARVVVDATADGDVAFRAGAPFQLGSGSDEGSMQPVSMYFKMNNVDLPKVVRWVKDHPEEIPRKFIADHGDYAYGIWISGFTSLLRRFEQDKGVRLKREYATLKTGFGHNEVFINATRVGGVNALDVLQASDAIVDCHRQIGLLGTFFREYVPGFEQAYINGIAPMLGVRETRHIIGEIVLTGADVRNQRTFDDCIGVDQSAMDIHDVSGRSVSFQGLPPYEIPYRCLVPKGIDQLLVAGRCISVDHEAHGRTRNMPACMVTGQAAGLAAAIAVREDSLVRNVDVASIQDALRQAGVATSLSEI